MIELVMTMIIIGVLAVTVLPRFDTLGAFDAAGFADQSTSLIRYAQKSAIAQRRWTTVDVGANPPYICSQTYAAPAFPTCTASCGGGANVAEITFPGGSARSPEASTTFGSAPPPPTTALCFDALGRPFALGSAAPLAVAATLNIYDNGAIARTITIEAETGYVR